MDTIVKRFGMKNSNKTLGFYHGRKGRKGDDHFEGIDLLDHFEGISFLDYFERIDLLGFIYKLE